MFFIKSPAPEVASSKWASKGMQVFTHIYKEFLSLKHSTIKDKIFLEAQEEHKKERVSICLRPCV